MILSYLSFSRKIKKTLKLQDKNPATTISIKIDSKRYECLEVSLSSKLNYNNLIPELKKIIEQGSNKKPFYPGHEASIYIKPPRRKLYVAKSLASKVSLNSGICIVKLPKTNVSKQTIFQPQMSWHGGESKHQGVFIEQGSIELKGYTRKRPLPKTIVTSAPSVSKDRMAATAICVAQIVLPIEKKLYARVKHNKTVKNVTIDMSPNSNKANTYSSPIHISINAKQVSTNKSMGVTIFVHNGLFNSDYWVSEQLRRAMVAHPITISSPANNAPVSYTLVFYLTETQTKKTKDKSIIFWAHSTNPSKHAFLAIRKARLSDFL